MPNQASMIQPNMTFSRSAGTGIQPMKMKSSDNTMNEPVAPPISSSDPRQENIDDSDVAME